MKYCDSCGCELNKNAKFCSNCGKNFSSPSCNNDQSGDSGVVVIVAAIVGLLFPLVGAILYYSLKNSNLKAAKTANACSWVSFLLQLFYFMFYFFSIFSFV